MRHRRADLGPWPVPSWHPDWHGEFTFASLRAFAEAVVRTTDLEPALAVIEDGYAHLDVFRGSTRVGVVHVDRGERDAPLYSVYAGAADEELHTSDTLAAIALLVTTQTALPAGAE